jgi:hypothetical protein
MENSEKCTDKGNGQGAGPKTQKHAGLLHARHCVPIFLPTSGDGVLREADISSAVGLGVDRSWDHLIAQKWGAVLLCGLHAQDKKLAVIL